MTVYTLIAVYTAVLTTCNVYSVVFVSVMCCTVYSVQSVQSVQPVLLYTDIGTLYYSAMCNNVHPERPFQYD